MYSSTWGSLVLIHDKIKKKQKEWKEKILLFHCPNWPHWIAHMKYNETLHLRLWLLTQDITPGAFNSVPEYKAKRKFLKRFINVKSKCLLCRHYCKGMASITFKAGLWMRAASQLLQEGCRSPWAKAVPELPGKLHLGPAACKRRGLSLRRPAGWGLWTAADGKRDSKAYRWIADKTGLPFGIGKNLGSSVQRCYLLVRNSWEGNSFRTPQLSACRCPRTVRPGGTDHTKMKLNRHLLCRFFSFSSPRPLPST